MIALVASMLVLFITTISHSNWNDQVFRTFFWYCL